MGISMHLSDLLEFRSVPAAGLYISLTRRCPLACAHCSTSSTPSSEEQSEAPIVEFVQSFTSENRPEFLMLTGGEPLLRPKLVARLTDIAHGVGTKVSVSSSLFFASNNKIPPPIERVLSNVDHLVVSIDQYHDREVPREKVLRLLRRLTEEGRDVSLHIVGEGPDDAYVSSAISDARRALEDRVPILVAQVQPVGRAAAWMSNDDSAPTVCDSEPSPCSLAAWPVVTFDGGVVLCCNQRVVDGHAPAHLSLGHIKSETWASVRLQHVESGIRRAIRVFGPKYLANAFGAGGKSCDGYCETCWKLSDDPQLRNRIDAFGSRPTMGFVEEEVGKALGRLPLIGVNPAYAHLAYLGRVVPQEDVSRCA